MLSLNGELKLHYTDILSNKELIYGSMWLLLKSPIKLFHIGNNDEWNNTSNESEGGVTVQIYL